MLNISDGPTNSSRPEPDDGPPISFEEYIRRIDPGYIFARHARALVAFLQQIADGTITRGMILMPPRHGKSRTTSELFPAYYVGRHPHHSVIGTSHGDSLAVNFGRTIREQMADSMWPFLDVRAAGSGVAGGDWRVEGHGGRFRAAGVGGSIIGRGAHLLLIDDPFKGQREADSPEQRQIVWEWYEGTARRRLENELAGPDGTQRRGAIILITTRWHDDDLAGRLLAAEKANPAADKWTVLSFPALAEEGDPLGRRPGAALWPQKFSQTEMETTRDNTAPRIWAAQYQQKPLTDAARIFQRSWMRHRYDLRVLPAYHRIIHVVDAAWKDGVHNSYSVIATWGRTDLSYDVLDIFRHRVSYPQLIAALRAHYWKWQPYGADELYIEDAASGTSAIQTLREEEDPRGIVNVLGFAVTGTQKLSFVETATPFFSAGRVRLPLLAPWLDGWVEEHVGYPTSEFDDQPVTTAMALTVLGRGSARRDEALDGFGKVGARTGQRAEDTTSLKDDPLALFGRYKREGRRGRGR